MTLSSSHFQGKKYPFRRYNLCNKKNTKKRRMDSDEVATDYKLKQFLKDVQKFSGRSKVKKGLFENGMISRPSMKGLFESKNKARLSGNLENLLNEEVNSVANSNGEGNSKEQDVAEERSDSEEKDISRDTEKLISWGNKFVEKPEEKVKCNTQGKFSRGNKVEDLTKDISFVKDLDDLIKFTEKRGQNIMIELKNTLSNVSTKSKEEFLFECQKNLVSALQKNFLEKALNEKESIFDNLRLVLEEYMKSKKPQMVDKSQQTSFPIEVRGQFPNPVEDDPEKNFFDSNFSEEKPFGFHPAKETNPEILTPLIKGSVNPFFGNKTSGIVIETPLEFRNSDGWPQPTVQRKNNYVPAILSPPSPGREYFFNWCPSTKPLTPLHQIPAMKSCINHLDDKVSEAPSPSFLVPPTSGKSRKGFSRFHLSSNNNLNRLSGLKRPSKENQLNCIGLNNSPSGFDSFEQSDDLLKKSSSFSELFQFPKRTKLQFSPHRL